MGLSVLSWRGADVNLELLSTSLDETVTRWVRAAETLMMMAASIPALSMRCALYADEQSEPIGSRGQRIPRWRFRNDAERQRWIWLKLKVQ
jgi:hypothetical protein